MNKEIIIKSFLVTCFFTVMNCAVVYTHSNDTEAMSSTAYNQLTYYSFLFGTIAASVFGYIKLNSDQQSYPKMTGAFVTGLTSIVTCAGFYGIGHFPSQGYNALLWGLLGLVVTLAASAPNVISGLQSQMDNISMRLGRLFSALPQPELQFLNRSAETDADPVQTQVQLER